MVAATRTRRSTDYSQEWPVDLFWSHDGGTYLNHHVHPSFSYWDEIIDQYKDSGRKRNKLVYSVHPCTHTRIRVNDCILRPFGADHNSTVIPLNRTPAELRPEEVLACVPAIPDSTRGDLNLEAFNSFTTQFPERISFAEFLGGLTKLKELLPSISGDVLRDLASAHLNQKFGWENLINDLKRLSTLLKDIQDRLAWLRKTYGRPTRLGFYSSNVYEPLLAPLAREVRAYPGWSNRYVPVSYRADYRAGSWLIQRLNHLDDMIGLFRSFVGALGLNNPVKAVWVNLPFSFVVDWFFNISSHLDRLTAAKPAEQWDLYGVTNSVVYTSRIRVEQFSGPWFDPGYGTDDQTTTIGYLTVRRYDRQVGLPVNPGQLNWENLSPDQLVLLLAMLGSSR